MSKITSNKSPVASNSDTTDVDCSARTFETAFVSMAGSSLVIEDEHAVRTQYSLAPEVLLTCDGKIGNEETLQAGRRIRVTTRAGQPMLVVSVEWLNANSGFPSQPPGSGS